MPDRRPVKRRTRNPAIVLILLFLCLRFVDVRPTAVVLSAQSAARQPRGIYAVFLDTGQRSYAATIDNPAIAGLFLYFHWATLEPREGQFDFTPIEAALQLADSKHKTIQLALIPGFWTPTWLLDKLASCDGRLASGPRRGGGAPPDCGKATFGLPEGYARKGEIHELPLPWNPVYKADWHAFLVEFAKRFGQRETIVSIAIAGPTSESEEIIMPHAAGEKEKWTQLLGAFYRDPSYHRSNKAFVEEWKAEIDDYGRIFSNVTLALTLAAGLPFSPPNEHLNSTTEIATYFARQPLGANAKATQNNGIAASHPQAMRPVMESVASLNPRVLAGGELGTAVSRDPKREGCLNTDEASAACQSLSLEQAFANVLTAFFTGTPYGHFYGAENGKVPVQYLQIYQGDVVYANSHPEVQIQLTEAGNRMLSLRLSFLFLFPLSVRDCLPGRQIAALGLVRKLLIPGAWPLTRPGPLHPRPTAPRNARTQAARVCSRRIGRLGSTAANTARTPAK